MGATRTHCESLEDAAADPCELADMARDEAREQALTELGPEAITCPACGYRHDREHVAVCDRCGETPASVEAARLDHEATKRGYC